MKKITLKIPDITLEEQAFVDAVLAHIDFCVKEELVIPTTFPITPQTVAAVNRSLDCSECGSLCCVQPMVDSKEENHIAMLEVEFQHLRSVLSHQQFQRFAAATKVISYKEIPCRTMQYPCMFLVSGKCQIYDNRFNVCRVFPISPIRIRDTALIGLDSTCPQAKVVAFAMYMGWWIGVHKKESTDVRK